MSSKEQSLQQKIDELSSQVHQVKSIVASAPFPIGVYVGREMQIQLANQSIIDIWGKGNDVIGRLYSEVLPELADSGIYEQLDGVFVTGIPYHAKSQRVDLVVEGKLQIFYFDYSFTPLYDETGEIYGVMNTAADVTELNLAKQKIEQSERNFHNMILQAPVAMCLLLGDDHKVEVANDLIIDLWGKPADQMLGKPIFSGLPEAREQGLEKLLNEVYQTGVPYKAIEQPVALVRGGELQTVYQNFVYEPYKDGDGTTLGVIAITTDVTEQVMSRKALERSYRQQQEMNEELAATNEELAAANEEIAATNEELLDTQVYLNKTVIDLENSEARLRYIMQEAPVAIAVMRGREITVESANKEMLKIWGKTPKVIGKTLPKAIPELEGQPFLQILDNVFTTGIAYSADEARVLLEHDGELREIFCNFVYQPVVNSKGETTDIIAVALEVTDQVRSRKKVEHAEESLRLATQAAEVGTWSLDVLSGKWSPSAQVKNIFGLGADDDMTYETAFSRIHPDYVPDVERAVNASLSRGEPFYIEYPIQEARQGKERWVRSVGKVITTESGEPVTLTGALIDITDQKHEVQRKNEFIGMVSHELKTPLTSLTAIIQVLNVKLRNGDDGFVSSALDRANVQVKKMAGMINGFLNLSRLESGKLQMVKEPFDLNEVVHAICEESKLTTQGHDIIVTTSHSVIVFADKEKIGSVISNLLSNAMKYSGEGSPVRISSQIVQDEVQVAVKDEGIGINPEEIDKIFTSYYRVQNERTRHISGFGIGLYLCSEIVERHGGKIWATSEPGKGSIFTFSLPLQSGELRA